MEGVWFEELEHLHLDPGEIKQVDAEEQDPRYLLQSGHPNLSLNQISQFLTPSEIIWLFKFYFQTWRLGRLTDMLKTRHTRKSEEC